VRDTVAYSYTYRNTNGYSNRYANTYAHCNSNCYAYAVTDASSITYTKNSPDPEESTHAPAATVEASLISQAAHLHLSWLRLQSR
jgi:hypothetical protein